MTYSRILCIWLVILESCQPAEGIKVDDAVHVNDTILESSFVRMADPVVHLLDTLPPPIKIEFQYRSRPCYEQHTVQL